MNTVHCEYDIFLVHFLFEIRPTYNFFLAPSLAEGDDRHRGDTRDSIRFRERIVRINYCFPCVNTAREGDAERPIAVIQ